MPLLANLSLSTDIVPNLVTALGMRFVLFRAFQRLHILRLLRLSTLNFGVLLNPEVNHSKKVLTLLEWLLSHLNHPLIYIHVMWVWTLSTLPLLCTRHNPPSWSSASLLAHFQTNTGSDMLNFKVLWNPEANYFEKVSALWEWLLSHLNHPLIFNQVMCDWILDSLPMPCTRPH